MTGRQMEVFFELHKDLPREGPGSSQSTQKAFSYVGTRFKKPRILDIGCGPGAQTLCLAEISNGEVFAVDNHAPFIDNLKRNAKERGLEKLVHPTLADMTKLPFENGSFDMIWAEGSIYIIGVETGLEQLRPLLKNDGIIAFTEVSWLKANIPEELNQFWMNAYPAITSIDENIRRIEGIGFDMIGHFILPDQDWWDDYYDPIQEKLPSLREKYKDDLEGMDVIMAAEKEIDLHHRFSSYYGYVFYIAEREDKETV